MGDGLLRRQQNAQQIAIPRPSCGIPFRTLPSGVSFTPDAKRATVATTSFPFRLTRFVDGGTVYVTVYPGTVSGVMPTIDSVPLDDANPEQLSFSASGTFRIYLKCECTLETTSEGYVLGYSGLEVEIVAEATPPTDVATGTFYRQIGTVVDGAITAQVIQNSLDLVARDSGTGEGEATSIFVVSG